MAAGGGGGGSGSRFDFSTEISFIQNGNPPNLSTVTPGFGGIGGAGGAGGPGGGGRT